LTVVEYYLPAAILGCFLTPILPLINSCYGISIFFIDEVTVIGVGKKQSNLPYIFLNLAFLSFSIPELILSLLKPFSSISHSLSSFSLGSIKSISYDNSSLSFMTSGVQNNFLDFTIISSKLCGIMYLFLLLALLLSLAIFQTTFSIEPLSLIILRAVGGPTPPILSV